MRPGRIAALDVGKSRIGVAVCDQDRILASPLGAVPRGETTSSSIDSVLSLLADYHVSEFVVGLPINLTGDDTLSTIDAREFHHELSQRFDCPVHLVDERLSTKTAQTKLWAGGRTTKESKHLIDAAAAAEILEHYLKLWRKNSTSE